MYNFALIGAAGYIAPRHMQAIKETNNNLVAILDKSDSVGIIDRYFPNAALFLEAERFDRHVYRLSKKGNGEQVDYMSICSPNYLHDAHIRLALRNNADAICEKPLVLNTWNLDGLAEMEKDGRSVTMCNIAQALEDRGIEKGIEKGITRGIQQEKISRIQKMIRRGYSKEDILEWEYTEKEYEEALRELHGE